MESVMSEDRLERIENQIGQLVGMFTTLHQDVTGMKQDITGMKQDITTLHQDVTGMKQDITGMKQDIAETKQEVATLRQDLTAMKQNVNAVREDLTALRNRVESIEGTVLVTIRSGHASLRDYVDDLNFEISETQRKHRLLNRRVRRLERKDDDDD
jgi:chromosome segregation ATPase